MTIKFPSEEEIAKRSEARNKKSKENLEYLLGSYLTLLFNDYDGRSYYSYECEYYLVPFRQLLEKSLNKHLPQHLIGKVKTYYDYGKVKTYRNESESSWEFVFIIRQKRTGWKKFFFGE